MSVIQNTAEGTAAASFVAAQVGNRIAGTFGRGYAKLVFGQAAWAASVGALGEKIADGTATGGDYATVIQKTGDLLLGLGLTILQVNPWVRTTFAVVSTGLFVYNNRGMIADYFGKAKNWVFPRDPIILDLDGNGLQTVGLTSNIYFDHNGDGILSKTGWVGEGDALLVWDRNSNGLIDNGAELFGDFTPMPDGSLAPNGFAALASLDANGDGILDASDPAFAELKLWVDSDQNGVTGEGELMSLADAGIASLNLGSTLKNQKQSNGNTLAREGSFTRTDGTESAMGEFHLAIDTFDTQFAEQIEVPEELRGLPMMNGSGNVRDLQQAATQSSSLQNLLSQFENSTDRFEQKALVDQILTRWANTSGMADSLDSRAKGEFRIEYEAFGNVRRSAHIVSSGVGAAGPSNTVGSGASLASDSGNQKLTAEYRALMSEWSNKLHVLEAFNGQYFFNLPDKKSLTPSANHGYSVVQPSSKPGTGGAAIAAESTPLLRINFAQQQLDLLQNAYDNLHESVYASLVLQTRLKPYLDSIELVLDGQGISLDTASLNQMLQDKREIDPEGYLADLNKYAADILSGTDWVSCEGLEIFISFKIMKMVRCRLVYSCASEELKVAA